jgi:hypothetical protein
MRTSLLECLDGMLPWQIHVRRRVVVKAIPKHTTTRCLLAGQVRFVGRPVDYRQVLLPLSSRMARVSGSPKLLPRNIIRA